MDLLLAIKKYCEKLMEYGYYPKTKKPSVGKLEKMADLCIAGKIRKLSRYIPDNATAEEREVLDNLLNDIKEIVRNERENN